jgi:SMI1 / KNR4 family (SUKH-1)
MMKLYEEVQRHFAGFSFGAPCSDAEIQRAEAALGEPIPDVLRELYRAFDGFLGPTDSVFFWPLFAGKWGECGLVDLNRFLREGDEFPRDLVSRCIFFGDDGGGPFWGIKRDLPGKVICWDAEWGDEFHMVGENPLEVWIAAKKAYEELGAGDPC